MFSVFVLSYFNSIAGTTTRIRGWPLYIDHTSEKIAVKKHFIHGSIQWRVIIEFPLVPSRMKMQYLSHLPNPNTGIPMIPIDFWISLP
jgi:hypothetical protein